MKRPINLHPVSSQSITIIDLSSILCPGGGLHYKYGIPTETDEPLTNRVQKGLSKVAVKEVPELQMHKQVSRWRKSEAFVGARHVLIKKEQLEQTSATGGGDRQILLLLEFMLVEPNSLYAQKSEIKYPALVQLPTNNSYRQ